MEPGRDPHLHRRVQAALPRAPQSRAREKTLDRKRKVLECEKKRPNYTYLEVVIYRFLHEGLFCAHSPLVSFKH